jgi:uncharacterized protein YndB with AHSA1/START domain
VSKTKPSGEALVIQRLLRVPRERVFAAWLDPVSVAQWMKAGGVDRVTAELDARVGGKFRIVMRHSGKDVEHWGEYRAIDPPAFLSFTWTSVHTDNRPTLVTVELQERGGSTEVTLTHRDLPSDEVDNHRQGWTAIFAELDRTLTGEKQ